MISMRKLAEHALQGHTEVQGIPIAIENRKGSVREGTTRDGHHWRTKMKAPYGYIEGTKGKDGEEIDAFVGPDKDAPTAYVVHQHKPDGTGFDEDKVIFGVRSLTEAKKLFTQHYDDPKFLGPIDKIPIEELKEKLDESAGKQIRKLAEVALTGPGEFAPGIPANRGIKPIPRVHSEKPETWHMAIQHHDAEKAGKHIDFRLVDPQGHAHSWALPKAVLPPPGGKVLAVQQPTHSAAYAARQGEFEIPEGYGKGRVRGSGLVPVEVVRSQPGRLRFNVYGGSKEGNQEYHLLQTPKGWLLQNISATAEQGVPGVGGHPIPHSKPKYSETPTEKVRFDNADEIHQAKLDGAHVTYHLRADAPMKVFSYRPTERATGVLEHTHKLPGWRTLKAPPALAGTVLRGELYATDQKGQALPAEQIGGLLNATVWRSREKQEQLGHLKPAIFDVVRWKGRDVEQAPYSQKLEMLKEVQSKMPTLQLPRTAVTEQEKRQLFSDIQAGKEPTTKEGIVSWHLGRATPTKAKFRPDQDAIITGVTPGMGKHTGRIGALQVKLPGKEAVTHVGTGMSDKLREEIAKNPDAYIGRAVKVYTQQVFPSGKMRAPSFGGFHLEKGKQHFDEGKEKTAEPPPPKGIPVKVWDRILAKKGTKEKRAAVGELKPPPGTTSSLVKGLPALLSWKYMYGPYLEEGKRRHVMMMKAVREGWPAGLAAE